MSGIASIASIPDGNVLRTSEQSPLPPRKDTNSGQERGVAPITVR